MPLSIIASGTAQPEASARKCTSHCAKTLRWPHVKLKKHAQNKKQNLSTPFDMDCNQASFATQPTDTPLPNPQIETQETLLLGKRTGTCPKSLVGFRLALSIVIGKCTCAPKRQNHTSAREKHKGNSQILIGTV